MQPVAWPPAWPWVASGRLRAVLLGALTDEQLDAALQGAEPDAEQAASIRAAQQAAPLGDSDLPWAGEQPSGAYPPYDQVAATQAARRAAWGASHQGERHPDGVQHPDGVRCRCPDGVHHQGGR